MKRREFLIKSIAGGFAITLPISVLQGCQKDNPNTVLFGVCTDVHKDIMHDSDNRLELFIKEAERSEVDFIIQLGDFCRPYDYNTSFMDIWNSFEGNKYHVIGNHDMDGGFSREAVLEYWQSISKYYSFDTNGIHFVVLDGNDINPDKNKASGYARFIGSEQVEWLKRDLRLNQNPVVIFSHQSLENVEGLENGAEIRNVLEKANESNGNSKIIACFSGHHHTDYYTQINDIYYIQINSMSYSWLGDDYKTVRYSNEIDENYPWIKYTVPYKESLFAMVQIKNGVIKITGKKSEFVGLSPDELGVPKRENEPIVPFILDRKLKF